MPLGQDPHLKGKARSIWAKRNKILVFGSNAGLLIHLLQYNIAKDAALFIGKVTSCALQFLHHLLRQNRQGDDLRMRMLQGCSSCFAMVLEDQNIFETAVLFQIKDAITKSPEH